MIPGSFHFEQAFGDIIRKEIQKLNVKQIINVWFDSCDYIKAVH